MLDKYRIRNKIESTGKRSKGRSKNVDGLDFKSIVDEGSLATNGDCTGIEPSGWFNKINMNT